YVVDTANCRVQRFDPTGHFLVGWGSPGSEAGQFRYPAGIAITRAGHVYVADSRNRRLQRFDAAGRYLASWTVEPGDAEPGFQNPRAIAVSAGGHLFVTDADSHCVYRFREVDEMPGPAADHGRMA
ncbi:MAG: hypothetical protein ICV68_14940, partial [Pyrinomonadaceae bacterium]|nr:hypothetical protein [Pyrinomonadaceae bacterium]